MEEGSKEKGRGGRGVEREGRRGIRRGMRSGEGEEEKKVERRGGG